MTTTSKNEAPFTWTEDNPPPPLTDTESISVEVATDRFRGDR